MAKRFGLLFGLMFLVACVPKRAPVPLAQPVPTTPPPVVEAALPQEVNLEVPFFSQAPDGRWGLPWQEACEEASAILAYYYVSGKSLTLELFKSELNGLFNWEKKNFGDYKDTTLEQTAAMIRGYWGFDHLRIVDNPTIDQVRRELARGNPVIAPFSGRDIKNPFYTNQGPYYHMMVIKGYDSKNFITNDVGTKRGHDYRYPFERLMFALHDWDSQDIRKGAKKVLVIQKGL